MNFTVNLIHSAFADSPQIPTSTIGATANPTAAAAMGSPQPNWMSMITLFAPMFVVMYFFIIRPQQKKAKEHQALVDQLKQGDDVITNAGILGRITGVTEKVLTVEIAEGVRIKVLKNQVHGLQSSLKPATK